MTDKEKAIAYDKALEKMKSKLKNFKEIIISKSDIEDIFLEHVDSEDERMRNIAINACKYMVDNFENSTKQYEDAITWLEKQSVQKLTLRERYENIAKSEWFKKTHEGMSVSDEEQTFHEGDWIVYKNEVCQIVKREEGCNKLVTVFGIEKELVNERNLSTARLWTIGDAKDGDVLAGSKEDVILMFRGIGNTEWDDVIDYHCYYDCYKEDFIIQEDVEYWGNIENNQLVPATKEQRDTLMKAMADAGYAFDFNKKELKIIDWSKHIKYEPNSPSITKEKPVNWSEEDEKIIRRIDSLLYAIHESEFEDIHAWLKSLKDRVQPQNGWKPSKEQIIALRWVLNNIPYNKHKEEISGLLDQIKDLFMEEYD